MMEQQNVTFEIINNLNKSCAARFSVNDKAQCTSYISALDGLASIYAGKVIKGFNTLDSAIEFGDMLGCANYLNNVSLYPGIENVSTKYNQTLLAQVYNESIEYKTYNEIEFSRTK